MNQNSEEMVADEEAGRSGPLALAAVRFASIYFPLLLLPWPISALFITDRLKGVSDLMVSGVAMAWQPLVDFAAQNIFHVGHPVGVVFGDTGSSDRLFDWLVNFWVLVIATAATAIWTMTRPSGGRRPGIFLRIYLRYTLAAVLLTYGSLKLSQFPAPYFSVLNRAFGEETPMGLLWTFIGASTGYTVCIGALEVLCGALLLFRRTTLLGSCLGFGLTLNIFLLNVFYDVPVKLFSFHLLMAALILILPDAGRLARLFLLNRPVPVREESPPRQRFLLVLKALFLMHLLCWDAVAAWEGYAKRNAPKSAIDGIWKVSSSGQDRRTRSNSGTTNLVGWQWLTIDEVGGAGFCRLWLSDGSVVSGRVNKNRLTLPGQSQAQILTLEPRGRDELAVRGVLFGSPVWVQLRRDQSWASLVDHRIHWIQEAPREP